MRLVAALKGDLERYMAEELATAEAAVTRGLREAGAGLKLELRRDTTQAGLGRRLANAWRSANYPRRGHSLGAATEVFSKAKKLHEVFDRGATIRSKNGFWLAIPTEDVPKVNYRRAKITPSNWPEHRFGPLRFVYHKSGPSLLVVDNQREAKGKRARSRYALSRNKKHLRTKEGLSTVTMFLLYKQVRLRKRLNFDRIAARWEGKVAALIDREFDRLDSAAGRR